MPEIKLKGSKQPWTKGSKKQRSFKQDGTPNFEQFIPFYGSTTQGDSRYSSTRWKRVREVVLGDDPTCPICMNLGVVNSAAHVDHVRLHDTEGISFYDTRNWWGLCASCHAVKSTLESHRVSCPYSYNFSEAKEWWMKAVSDAKQRNK